MIRFRFKEDEQRYYRLLAEVYRIVAASAPPDQVSVAMRNLGKLQDVLMLEGVRQGVAAAAISNISKEVDGTDLETKKAFQLHAQIYGSQNTPLRDVEVEWLHSFGATHRSDDPWLDPQPMRFAPDTEQSYLAEQAQGRTPVLDGTPREAMRDASLEASDADFDFEALLGDDDHDAQERPELLDRIRDALLDINERGSHPRSWEDLIMRLHMALHVDAGFIDLQLGTPMGQTVLAQAGFAGIQPGPYGTDLSAVEQLAAEVTPQEAAPSPAGPAAPDDGSSPEDA